MATCEIIGGSFGARVSYSVSQDVANNRSTVRVTRVEMRALSSAGYPAYVRGSISVNGVQATVLELTDTTSCGISLLTTEYAGGGEGSWSGFRTSDVTIPHNDDGTAEIPIRANLSVYTSTASGLIAVGSAISKSVNVSLPTIPRVSELSASPVELGQTMTIRISRAASGFTDTVTWSCAGQSGTIAGNTGETSILWTVPLELAYQVPSSTNAAVTITVTTFQGSTQIGSKAVTVSCPVPGYLVPSLSIQVADKLGYSGICGGYVQNQSQARVTTQASGSYGSSITSISVRCGKLTGSGSDVCFALEESGTMDVSVTVTDSRGRTATQGTQITVLAYRKPSVTITEGYRCDASGNQKPDGDWLKLVFHSQVTALTGNTAAYTGSCTVHGGGETRQASLTDYAGQFQVYGGSFLLSAGIDTAYDCKISVQDRFCTADSSTVLISVAFALFDMCRDTRAIGIGARAAKANKLCIGLTADMGECRIENLADPAQNKDAATKAYVDWLVNDRLSQWLASVYPVGSIYISASDTSPASLFGGTWEQLRDRFLIGAGGSYGAGSTGGEAMHTLTESELPAHRHNSGQGWWAVSAGSGKQALSNTTVESDELSGNMTGFTGGGGAHNNMPPYLAVYMWKRVA